MIRLIGAAVLSLLLFTVSAFAGGDQNMKRHDGELGQGAVNQVRNSD